MKLKLIYRFMNSQNLTRICVTRCSKEEQTVYCLPKDWNNIVGRKQNTLKYQKKNFSSLQVDLRESLLSSDTKTSNIRPKAMQKLLKNNINGLEKPNQSPDFIPRVYWESLRNLSDHRFLYKNIQLVLVHFQGVISNF